MKTQFGEMLTGDFQEKTMTFIIEGEMELQAGRYAIVPIEKYNKPPQCHNPEVVAALEECLDTMEADRKSGDCGFWE